VSGVFFSIPAALEGKPAWIAQLISLNPAAAYIDIVRQSLLENHEQHSLPNAWPIAIGWSIVALVGGFVYFWRAEERYGRG
jgi:teichoic acid transport system permease protein